MGRPVRPARPRGRAAPRAPRPWPARSSGCGASWSPATATPGSSQLIDETGWSRRHLTRRFRQQIGLPPKACARLLRFEHAVDLLGAPGASLASVAVRGGLLRPGPLQPRLPGLRGLHADRGPFRPRRHGRGFVGSGHERAHRTSSRSSSTRTSQPVTTTWWRCSGSPPVGCTGLDDGTVVHGEVTLGDHTIWLHAVAPDHEMETPSRLPTSHGGLSVHIPDVDAHFEKLKAAGARIDSTPDGPGLRVPRVRRARIPRATGSGSRRRSDQRFRTPLRMRSQASSTRASCRPTAGSASPRTAT